MMWARVRTRCSRPAFTTRIEMTTPTSSYPPGAETFVLCYVSYPWAWFTTDLKNTWGDDWNDAPYEHNAGEPYGWASYMQERGVEPYLILRVAYDGPFEAPDAYVTNSQWSVEQINAGMVPWLQTDRYIPDHRVTIMAGMPLPQFERAILEGGGNIFRPVVSPLQMVPA
jgi:hypothetical protein